jgi:hypothetical protein
MLNRKIQSAKGGLISESFFFHFGSNLQKFIIMRTIVSTKREHAQDSDLGCLSQSEKLSEIKPPLLFDF